MGGKLQNKIEKLHSWICNHPHVVNLTLTNNHINIRYNKTCEVIKTQKLHIKLSIRELHNDLIKPPQEGVFSGAILELGSVIIGDKLIKNMPTQNFKMSNHRNVMRGCEICISASMMQCKLSSWESRHI